MGLVALLNFQANSENELVLLSGLNYLITAFFLGFC